MADKRKYADRAEYLKVAVAKRRKRVRQMAVNYLGAKCAICGYNKCSQALDAHHRDESTKSFGISSKGYTRSWKAIESELKKCVLICANCHREMHAGITQLPPEMVE